MGEVARAISAQSVAEVKMGAEGFKHGTAPPIDLWKWTRPTWGGL